jgi:hypothetical protein
MRHMATSFWFGVGVRGRQFGRAARRAGAFPARDHGSPLSADARRASARGQYSSGNNTVVALRSASVMTQTRTAVRKR